MAAGCGKKKSTTKKVKTEDLDEATLQGMAKDITKEMSLKNKIGQLFMVSIYQLDEAESKNQTKITDGMKKTLKKYPAGGIVMFAKNIETREQTKTMIKDLQDTSYVPLFMAVRNSLKSCIQSEHEDDHVSICTGSRQDLHGQADCKDGTDTGKRIKRAGI